MQEPHGGREEKESSWSSSNTGRDRDGKEKLVGGCVAVVDSLFPFSPRPPSSILTPPHSSLLPTPHSSSSGPSFSSFPSPFPLLLFLLWGWG